MTKKSSHCVCIFVIGNISKNHNRSLLYIFLSKQKYKMSKRFEKNQQLHKYIIYKYLVNIYQFFFVCFLIMFVYLLCFLDGMKLNTLCILLLIIIILSTFHTQYLVFSTIFFFTRNPFFVF